MTIDLTACDCFCAAAVRSHAGFSAQLVREVARQGYESPTAIQTQALPVAMSGRDLIGAAGAAVA